MSKRIARLEERLGGRLLTRTTRTVVPTEVGAAFYARAARILADLEEVEHEITSHGGAPRGKLRVTAPVVFGERHLAPLLPGFLARYPDVRVELSLDDRHVSLVEEHLAWISGEGEGGRPAATASPYRASPPPILPLANLSKPSRADTAPFPPHRVEL